jgi:hypothetical protein
MALDLRFSLMQVHFHPCISFSFVFMVQSFERRKMQKAVLHFFDRSSELSGHFDDFLRMLGFPLCFSSSGLFGTTFGQSGGFSTRFTPALGFGVFPGTFLSMGPQIQHLMSPCTTIQLR